MQGRPGYNVNRRSFWAAKLQRNFRRLILDSFFGPFDKVNRAMRREFQLLVELNQLLARHVRSRAYCLTVLNLCLPGRVSESQCH